MCTYLRFQFQFSSIINRLERVIVGSFPPGFFTNFLLFLHAFFIAVLGIDNINAND